jgi:tetratricopeptide (TPR) repeat protein
MSHEKTVIDLTEFIKKIKEPILGIISLASTIYSFWQSIKSDNGILIILLAIVILLLEAICLYYFWFWKPKQKDITSSIILQPDPDATIKSQRKAKRQKRIVRLLSAVGLFLIPILFWGGWQYVASLPPQNITILVADFDGPDPDNYRVAATIRGNLKKETARYPNIKVKSTKIIKETEGSEEAREAGKKQKATIVVWGWYWKTKDIMPISVHFELLNWPSFSYISGTSLSLPSDLTNKKIQILPISQLEKSITIQTHLSKEMTYLTLLTLGISHSFAEEWEDAIEKFTRALEQMQNIENKISNFSKAQVLTLRGNARSSQGDLLGALTDLDKAIQIEPNNASSYISRSLIRIRKHNEQGALADINTAIKLAPQSPQAYLNRGIIHGLYLQDSSGIKDVNKFIQLNPKESDGYSVRGSIRIGRGDFTGGLSDLEKAIELNPKDYLSYSQRGSYLCQKGDIKEGIADLDKAIQLNLKNSNIYALRGSCRIQIGDKEEGMEDLNKAIQLNPKSSEAYTQRGSYWIELGGDKKQGITDFTKAIQLNPIYYLAYLQRGNSRIQIGDKEEGMKDLNKGIQLNPKSSEAYVLRGNTHIQFGDKKRGNEDLDKAIFLTSQDIQRNPANALAYSVQGNAHFLLDKNKDVIADFSKVLQLNRRDYLSFVMRANAYLSLKNFKGAISDFNQAILLKPDSFQAYFGRGLSYHYQKNYRQALSDYDHALHLKTNFIEKISKIEILKNMGIINYEVGSKDEALRLFEIIREDKEGRNHLSSNFAFAVALSAKGQEQESFELAKSVLNSDKDYSSIDFLKKKQLWGNRFINDAQKFLSRSDIKALM